MTTVFNQTPGSEGPVIGYPSGYDCVTLPARDCALCPARKIPFRYPLSHIIDPLLKKLVRT